MTIEKKIENAVMTVALEGKLNTTTAPDLDAALKDLAGITSLVLDFEKLEYVSSAGLRVLLTAQNAMNAQGTMTILHVNETISEVFEVTGFSNFLNVK